MGLEDVSKYPTLTAELLRRGYTDEDIKKILGLNMLRVMRGAEEVAAKLQKERGRPVDSSMLFSQKHDRAPGRAIRIVALGDSTTAGTPGFKSQSKRRPTGAATSEPVRVLADAGAPEWRVLNRGVNGERSDQIAARFERDVLAPSTGAVVIIAGVNDVYQGRAASTSSRSCAAMYDRAAQAGIRVVAGTIVPYNTATPDQNARMRADQRLDPQQPRRSGMAFVDTRAAAAAPDDLDPALRIARRTAPIARRLPPDGGRDPARYSERLARHPVLEGHHTQSRVGSG